VDQEDEALKTTVTAQEIAGTTPALAEAPALSRSVLVPVLLVVGQFDALNRGPRLSCASAAVVLTHEAADFSPAARLRAYVLPGAAHDVNLAPDAAMWFAAAIRWAARYAAGPSSGS
jgi:hypothetical protein